MLLIKTNILAFLYINWQLMTNSKHHILTNISTDCESLLCSSGMVDI